MIPGKWCLSVLLVNPKHNAFITLTRLGFRDHHLDDESNQTGNTFMKSCGRKRENVKNENLGVDGVTK